MKKDIVIPVVEGVSVAVVKETEEQDAMDWKVYLLNKNEHPIDSITIRSKGYGVDKDGEPQQTSTFRFFIDSLAPKSAEVIEAISPEVFHLNNEYWVSYVLNNQLFDKKFVFVTESILEANFVYIPLLDKKGVLHS